jgi:hypothetical protein
MEDLLTAKPWDDNQGIEDPQYAAELRPTKAACDGAGGDEDTGECEGGSDGDGGGFGYGDEVAGSELPDPPPLFPTPSDPDECFKMCQGLVSNDYEFCLMSCGVAPAPAPSPSPHRRHPPHHRRGGGINDDDNGYDDDSKDLLGV